MGEWIWQVEYKSSKTSVLLCERSALGTVMALVVGPFLHYRITERLGDRLVRMIEKRTETLYQVDTDIALEEWVRGLM